MSWGGRWGWGTHLLCMSVCLAALAAVPGLLPILGQTRLSLAIIKHSAPFKTV